MRSRTRLARPVHGIDPLTAAGIGAGLAGLLGGGGGTSTQTNNPPAYLEPYLRQVANAAQAQFFGGTVWPGQTTGTPLSNVSPLTMSATLSDTGQPLQGGGRMNGGFIPGSWPNASPNNLFPTMAASPSVTGGNPVTFNRPEFFPGSTVVPFSGETNQALQLASQRAMSGSPLNQQAGQFLGGVYDAQNPAFAGLNQLSSNTANPANAFLTETARGDYLNGPGLDRAFQAASNRITPQVQSAFARGGRLNSGLAQEALTSALGDAYAGLYGDERNRQLTAQGQLSQNYATGVNQQLGALGQMGSNFLGQQGQGLAAASLAPTLAAQDYADIGQLANVGAQREGLAQQNLQEGIDRFYFDQNVPNQLLAQYAAMINGQGALGFGTSLMQQPRASTAQNLLGGALAGYGFNNLLG